MDLFSSNPTKNPKDVINNLSIFFSHLLETSFELFQSIALGVDLTG